MTQILTTRMNAHPSDSQTLSRYEQTGGYAVLRRALAEMQPEQITAEVKASNLRGRGGANFPCGVKWGFLAPAEPRYLVINADDIVQVFVRIYQNSKLHTPLLIFYLN